MANHDTYDEKGNKIQHNFESMYNGLVDVLLFVLDNKENDVEIRKRDSDIENYILEEVCEIIRKAKE